MTNESLLRMIDCLEDSMVEDYDSCALVKMKMTIYIYETYAIETSLIEIMQDALRIYIEEGGLSLCLKDNLFVRDKYLY